MRSPNGGYTRYLDQHIKVDRVFDRGQETLIAKVLPVTDDLRREQGNVVPVEMVPFDEKRRKIVVALNVSGREPVNLMNWELRLGGRKSISYTEVIDSEIIERVYPFGYPFYRVYVVEFPVPAVSGESSDVETFEILSPYGRLDVKADFRETKGEK